MNIKKGDLVVIRRGKDRGSPDKPRTGKVLHVFPRNNSLIVEGVNLISRHTRPSKRNPKGGIVRKEAPINRSKVALFCKECSASAKIGYRMLSASEGSEKKMRICRRCGEAI
jgi:large subunit ribosomal protein L24